MEKSQVCYIVKQNDGVCDICDGKPPEAGKEESQEKRVWGPFRDRQETIARRIGLIRAGKCQPKQP
ncbi:MAG: DDE transposase family protein [Cyanobacteria bacterium P01_E01_bin.42]